MTRSLLFCSFRQHSNVPLSTPPPLFLVRDQEGVVGRDKASLINLKPGVTEIGQIC